MSAAVYRIRGADPEAIDVSPRVGSFRIVRDGARKQFRLQELREYSERAWPWFWRWRVYTAWKEVDAKDWHIQGEGLAKKAIMRLLDEAIRERNEETSGPTVIWSEP